MYISFHTFHAIIIFICQARGASLIFPKNKNWTPADLKWLCSFLSGRDFTNVLVFHDDVTVKMPNVNVNQWFFSLKFETFTRGTWCLFRVYIVPGSYAKKVYIRMYPQFEFSASTQFFRLKLNWTLYVVKYDCKNDYNVNWQRDRYDVLEPDAQPCWWKSWSLWLFWNINCNLNLLLWGLHSTNMVRIITACWENWNWALHLGSFVYNSSTDWFHRSWIPRFLILPERMMSEDPNNAILTLIRQFLILEVS